MVLMFFREIRLDVSCESSAKQRSYMKHQALFCSKDKSEKIKVSSTTVLLGCRKKTLLAVRLYIVSCV